MVSAAILVPELLRSTIPGRSLSGTGPEGPGSLASNDGSFSPTSSLVLDDGGFELDPGRFEADPPSHEDILSRNYSPTTGRLFACLLTIVAVFCLREARSVRR